MRQVSEVLPHGQSPDLYKRVFNGEKVTFKDLQRKPGLELDADDDGRVANISGDVHMMEPELGSAASEEEEEGAYNEEGPEESIEDSLGRLLEEMYPGDFPQTAQDGAQVVVHTASANAASTKPLEAIEGRQTN